MILPTALIDRSPGDIYTAQHQSVESALKHNVSDALMLYHELKILREIEKTFFAVDPDEHDKMLRQYFKRCQTPTLDQTFAQYIIDLNNKFDRCIKLSDYPAMIMAAYPESRFMDKSRYWKEYESIDGPVLLRGISNGKIADHAREKGKDYYFIETGYLGNYRSPNNLTGRKIYHRIVKNAMQHSRIMDVPDDRWRELVRFNPNLEYRGWRKPGSKILLVLSTQKPFEYYGEDREQWIKDTIKTIKKYTDREIVIREKAGRGERTNDTIYDALDNDIYALVTYNSIAAVEAIQYGIPAFALAPTAAAPVCSDDLTRIEQPIKLGEHVIRKWLNSIAYSQFSLDEILTGQAWRMVLDNEHRPTFNR